MLDIEDVSDCVKLTLLNVSFLLSSEIGSKKFRNFKYRKS